ncbi:MAG TPA: hypothetical protein VFG14_08145, partial [Chthoniobacteraceae bacterium]|nr:hypothetical protein [Chthoniobacteraceae bacterium]
MKAQFILPVILTLAANVLAQKATEKKKPKDPFVRGGAPAATNPPPSDPANIYALIEYIEVPRDLWLEYTSTNPIGHNSAPLRAEVQKWISEGKAKPIEISCEVTKSGNRTVSESIIERQFPTGYSPWNKVSLPIAFETRNSHLTFEWEPILSDDGSKVDSNLAIRLTKFAGNSFDTIEQRKSLQPDDIGQPLFVSYRTTLSVATSPSEPKLLDVMTPYDGSGKLREDACLLLFFRGSPVNIVVPDKGLPPDNKSLNLEVERLEVSLTDLNSWFAEKDLVAGTQQLRETAAGWIKEGRGKVVDRRLSPARSGQRHVVENIFEVRYPI